MAEARLERVTEHVWRFTPDERTDRPALGAVAGPRGTVLLDAGASPLHVGSFLDALDRAGVARPLACVLTHWHWDHSFGAQATGVPVIGHRLTADALLVQASYDWSDEALTARVETGQEIAFVADMLRLELPDRSALQIVPPHVIIEDRLTLDLGGVTCVIEHVGGDHAEDSCVIYVVEDNLLFLGDALYQRRYAPVEHFTPVSLVPLVDRIAAFGAGAAIEGHADEVYDGAGLSELLTLLRSCAERAQKHGAAALEDVSDSDEREILQCVLAGIELHGENARHP